MTGMIIGDIGINPIDGPTNYRFNNTDENHENSFNDGNLIKIIGTTLATAALGASLWAGTSLYSGLQDATKTVDAKAVVAQRTATAAQQLANTAQQTATAAQQKADKNGESINCLVSRLESVEDITERNSAAHVNFPVFRGVDVNNERTLENVVLNLNTGDFYTAIDYFTKDSLQISDVIGTLEKFNENIYKKLKSKECLTSNISEVRKIYESAYTSSFNGSELSNLINAYTCEKK